MLNPVQNTTGGEMSKGLMGVGGRGAGLGVTPPESHNSSSSGTDGGSLDRSVVESREGGGGGVGGVDGQ